jgi:hypothetical protein
LGAASSLGILGSTFGKSGGGIAAGAGAFQLSGGATSFGAVFFKGGVVGSGSGIGVIIGWGGSLVSVSCEKPYKANSIQTTKIFFIQTQLLNCDADNNQRWGCMGDSECYSEFAAKRD